MWEGWTVRRHGCSNSEIVPRYTDVLLHNGLRPVPDASKMDLHWDSWQQLSTVAAGPFPTTPSSSSARDPIQ